MTASKLYGIHTIRNALYRSGLVQQVWLQTGREDERIDEILTLAKQQQVTIQSTDRQRLTQLAGTDKHQGVVAQCQSQDTLSLSELETRLIQQSHAPLLLCLDGLQDPHNLGACIRSANAAACDAVLIPKNRCATVTPTVHKVSAGAAVLTPVIAVSSLGKTCQNLKAYNIQSIGFDGDAEASFYDIDFTLPTALLMGAEGTGLRPALREQCDHLVKIPMPGLVASLNVSVATGIALFEVQRQRMLKQQ